jgi:hypothetical protein
MKRRSVNRKGVRIMLLRSNSVSFSLPLQSTRALVHSLAYRFLVDLKKDQFRSKPPGPRGAYWQLKESLLHPG